MNNSDTIRDILIGKGSLEGYFERLISFGDVEDSIELEEIDCISGQSSITFKMSRNKNTEETDYIKSSLCDIDFDDEKLTTILGGMIPENSVDCRCAQHKKQTVRIIFLLPNRVSDLCSNEENRNNFKTSWKHFHVNAFQEEWTSNEHINYCARLSAAFYELGMFGNSVESKILQSIIKSSLVEGDSSLAGFFHIYMKDDIAEYKDWYKDFVRDDFEENEERKRYFELFRKKRIGGEELSNHSGYRYLLDFENLNERDADIVDYGTSLFSLKKAVKKTGFFKKVQTRSSTGKETERAKSDYLRMLQGLLYTLTLFSGSIVTLEIPRSIRRGKPASKKAEGGTAKDKKRNELLMFEHPLIICPTPIADMLLDLRKNHERLDRLLGFDRELSKKELNLKDLKISSPYTLHLLLNHSKIDPSLAAILWENVRDLKIGSSPEKVIENLRNTLNLTVTGNYLGDAIPRKSVLLPLTKALEHDQ